jgi:probable F420-dependent oxidoreductase
MPFGIRLPVQAQSTLYAEPWEARAGVDEIASVARVAEHSGFAYVAVCDHVAMPKERACDLTAVWWDCVATLSYLAAVTQRVRLVGRGYALALRHPLAVAKQWATLDALSGGRAILGVGGGTVASEFTALGVDHARRDALLDEALDAVRAAFDDEFSSHAGDAWAYDQVGIAPRPVQHHLPVWVGGSTDVALRRAAARGDGWVPSGPPDGGMSAGIARLRGLLDDAGRADESFTIGARSGALYVGEPRWDVGRAVHGSPEQVAGFLRVLAGLGVDQIEVAFRSRDVHELCDQVRLFGAEVAPLVV